MCIPFKYKNSKDGGGAPEKVIEVFMINSPSGPGLLFPKYMRVRKVDCIDRIRGCSGWKNDETAEEAAEMEAMEEAGVQGDLVLLTLKHRVVGFDLDLK
ncbi:hypothetical protein C2S51_038621 [Perilla frutescens var. frutescens]|nr:hypothetical protein C2S51_038621 [Perilla frutescens var. frutescens]